MKLLHRLSSSGFSKSDKSSTSSKERTKLFGRLSPLASLKSKKSAASSPTKNESNDKNDSNSRSDTPDSGNFKFGGAERLKNFYEEYEIKADVLVSRFCDKLETKTFWELVKIHDKIDPTLEFLNMISAVAIFERMSLELEKGLEIVQ